MWSGPVGGNQQKIRTESDLDQHAPKPVPKIRVGPGFITDLVSSLRLGMLTGWAGPKSGPAQPCFRLGLDLKIRPN